MHVSLPDDILVDIEENKHQCQDCGRVYYSEQIRDDEYGIFIDSFMPPKDGHCVDCGSSNIQNGSDPITFEQELESYKVHLFGAVADAAGRLQPLRQCRQDVS